MTRPVGGPSTPGGQPNEEVRIAQSLSKGLESFIDQMRSLKHSPHLADSPKALKDFATMIQALDSQSKEALRL